MLSQSYNAIGYGSRQGNIWDESKKEWKMKQDDPIFVASHADLGMYFIRIAPLSVIDNYRHEDYEYYGQSEDEFFGYGLDRKLNSHLIDNENGKWRSRPPVNFVSFIPINSEARIKYKRPIVDEFGNTFWVDGNDFTGTCNQFRWETVANLRFAREVKQTQDYYNQNNRGITCSCECRVGKE